MKDHRKLLRQYLDEFEHKKIDTELGMYLLSFADWLDVQHDSLGEKHIVQCKYCNETHDSRVACFEYIKQSWDVIRCIGYSIK